MNFSISAPYKISSVVNIPGFKNHCKKIIPSNEFPIVSSYIYAHFNKAFQWLTYMHSIIKVKEGKWDIHVSLPSVCEIKTWFIALGSYSKG